MNADVDLTSVIAGYRPIEQLYCGSRTLVYRAIRETDQHPVVIKLLNRDYPSFSELLQFRNQYTIAKNLHLPGVVEAYTLESYRNSYALVMEDFGGISLREYTQDRSLTLTEVLAIAIQITDILNGLYRNRVIHKDIKPANVLIHPETKQVKLIDFSIASLLPRETQEIQNPNVLEGTLAYISPEQTGRMNRGIDYRTDFYSLGVTLYELLTGELPFGCDDPMELVHCHIAKHPPSINNEEIPPVVSDMVMKLMAKNAEERYQSALGLKHDLERCLHQWKETGSIELFELGQRDLCDRFLIPEKLYGRETEVQTLLSAFDRVANGRSELMLVAGFSGIGKTAVVNEVHKPIVRQRGYFIKGKFDQFNRNIPFSAFVQAFRDLMGQLLAESDAQLKEWKTKILEAIGDSGQVIIEVIPELERIIGQQPPAPELSGIAAQNLFNLLFHKFIAVFTTKEHPLVMFLDDLQWVDSASLKLIQLLVGESQSSYLLMIGAYRDNEVSPGHPLMLTLDEVSKAGAIRHRIVLAPLARTSLNQLVAATLTCSSELAQPLTELVDRKTQGNPFFATQFLKALHQDELISFDIKAGHWQCDISKVREAALTDDVVEFMAQQLQKLPTETQDVLKFAACIGAQFDLNTLAIVSEKSPVITATALWKALHEGLVIPTTRIYKFFTQSDSSDCEEVFKASGNPTYRFLHDRVQQAAYSLIPDDRKHATHWKIGQRLLKNIPEAEREKHIFEIVNQLNNGLNVITQPHQRYELAQLNLLAGHKAKVSTAYNAALRYLTVGLEQLTPDSWQIDYQLTLALYLEGAEAEYFNGNFARSQTQLELILTQAKTLLDQTKAYILKVEVYIAQVQMQAALELGLSVMERLGVSLEEEPPQLQEIEALINLPDMTDPEKLAALRILHRISDTACVVYPQLLAPFALTMVNLCIRHGNSPLAASAYAGYGILLCGVLNDIDSGYRYGQLSLRLLEKLQSLKFKAHVWAAFNGHIRLWKESVRETLKPLLLAYSSGLESGEIVPGGYAILNYCSHSLFVGEYLETVARKHRDYIDEFQKQKLSYHSIFAQIGRQGILNLLGQAENYLLLIGSAFNESEMMPVLLEQQNGTSLFYVYLIKAILHYFFNQPEQALANLQAAEPYEPNVSGLFISAQRIFYQSLASLDMYPYAEANQQQQLLEQLTINQTRMQHWAYHAPMNFKHKVDLVEAEKCRILGKNYEAGDWYDRAISGAKENEYIQEEAIANELAAKFYLEWGKERIAQSYMIEAYYSYSRWGAKAKAADLETRYPQLLAPILQQTRSRLSTHETLFTLGTVTSTYSSSSSVSNSLDLAAILKASQTLSGEIELEKLLSTLLHIVIENAGADKCVLMILRDDSLRDTKGERLSIEGSMAVGTEPVVLQRLPVEESQDIPLKLIYKVKHNRQTVVLLDASADPTLANDAYIIRQQPKSILCSPILHQGKLMGILYLENNLATGAFTSDRVELLNLLCAQAAISLENAQLYERSQNYAQQLEQSLAELSASNSRFEKLVDNVPGVVYQYRIIPDAVISLSYISADCYSLLEITPEQAMSNWQFFDNMVHPDDIASYQQSQTHTIQTLSSWQWSGRIVTPSGIIKWIHGESRIQKLADGSMVWDGLFLDISDRKVAEIALQQKSLALENALNSLQQAQIQIVQSEKMSALGNLVAGVAHEINNPVGCIIGNVGAVQDSVNDLFDLIDLYNDKFPQPGTEIEEELETIDLEYLRSDLPKLIRAMKDGGDRITSISKSLRTFSRADSDQKQSFNLHEGIDSTILILRHRLKANDTRPAIEVITNYGKIPEINCFPGQLNQVFMNIIANAIDALEESNQGLSFADIKAHPNQITIQTIAAGDRVYVAIADNGKGMTEEVKARIFDYLFTTKDVGKGTGLGLAIAHQIVVEKHRGVISVNSTPGKGTEFVLELPMIKN